MCSSPQYSSSHGYCMNSNSTLRRNTMVKGKQYITVTTACKNWTRLPYRTLFNTNARAIAPWTTLFLVYMKNDSLHFFSSIHFCSTVNGIKNTFATVIYQDDGNMTYDTRYYSAKLIFKAIVLLLPFLKYFFIARKT